MWKNLEQINTTVTSIEGLPMMMQNNVGQPMSIIFNYLIIKSKDHILPTMNLSKMSTILQKYLMVFIVIDNYQK